MSDRIKQCLHLLAPLLVLGTVLLVWHLAASKMEISPILLPSPQSVLAALTSMRHSLWEATVQTSIAAALGLLCSTLLGVSTAYLFSQSSLVRATFYPYAILLQTIPIIAVAPMVVIGFGRGLHSVAVISAILGLFPVITSTTTGLLQIDRGLLELFHLHSATRWQLFWKLRLPGALPYLISGMRIAGGACIVGAIVGEFFVGASRPGLGALIQRKASGISTDELYATVAVSTLLGVITFVAITVAGELVLRHGFGMSLKGGQLDGDTDGGH